MVAQQNIQTTELYILNVWIICYVNYISIKYMYGIKICSNNYLLYLLSSWKKSNIIFERTLCITPQSHPCLSLHPLYSFTTFIYSLVLYVFERHIKGTILYVQSVLLKVTCVSEVTELCKFCNKNHTAYRTRGQQHFF